MNVLALLLYAALTVSSALLIHGVTAFRRGSGGPVHDATEAAFLIGGPARVVDAALAALHSDGRLAVGGPGIVVVRRPVAHDHVERAVLHEHAAAPSGALHVLRLAAMRNPAVQEVGDDLAARGLLVPRAAGRRWRRLSLAQGLGCLLLFFASLVLTLIELGSAEPGDLPFPFLGKVAPALVAGGIVAGVCGAVASGRITRAGRRAVEEYRRAYAAVPAPGHPVALYGPRALPDPVLREQLGAAARMHRRGGAAGRPGGGTSSADQQYPTAGAAAVVWCAGTAPGGSGCGGSGGGQGCGGASGGGGSGCGGSGGSSCGGSGGGGSSCGSSGGSGCGGGGGS
ncbi:TIGR04222 domain-containing membrane protein [Streptomyces sp. SP18CS02]|uniref:TIGR04222 domain-containing membrane protein n=1 Tax=Streptomyces sp. SP18CS02 TaxID=3002531 RepID=UPI002E75FDA6|nr:TIGR04222 domain-containing membrane protein [Streptomyces sp. SP18CS02]MEE1756532.1 TIGR04222 domain-containing membrane protein [Streptomyces sp. SP18CS02]